MFGAGDPDRMVEGMPPRRYKRLQAYYRYVSGWKAGDQNVTVEKTGVDIESDAVIIDG